MPNQEFGELKTEYFLSQRILHLKIVTIIAQNHHLITYLINVGEYYVTNTPDLTKQFDKVSYLTWKSKK